MDEIMTSEEFNTLRNLIIERLEAALEAPTKEQEDEVVRKLIETLTKGK